MNRLPRYYLDTSIFNFAIAEDVPESRRVTNRWLADLSGETFISPLVIGEIDRAPEPIRLKLNAVINQCDPEILPVTEGARALAQLYVRDGLIPSRYLIDALHIAIAVVHDMDVVVSWNMEHMVKWKTRRGVNAIHLAQGYRAIDICTPEEVLDP